jgi:hypothetical protein
MGPIHDCSLNTVTATAAAVGVGIGVAAVVIGALRLDTTCVTLVVFLIVLAEESGAGSVFAVGRRV